MALRSIFGREMAYLKYCNGVLRGVGLGLIRHQMAGLVCTILHGNKGIWLVLMHSRITHLLGVGKDCGDRRTNNGTMDSSSILYRDCI